LRFQVGLSMSPYVSDDFSVLLATDVIHPNDNDELICTGIEARILQILVIRGGYRFGDDTARWSVGGGASVPLGNLRVAFDYAFVSYDLLPAIHRVGIGLAF
jgi:hypothetical protein